MFKHSRIRAFSFALLLTAALIVCPRVDAAEADSFAQPASYAHSLFSPYTTSALTSRLHYGSASFENNLDRAQFGLDVAFLSNTEWDFERHKDHSWEDSRWIFGAGGGVTFIDIEQKPAFIDGRATLLSLDALVGFNALPAHRFTGDGRVAARGYGITPWVSLGFQELLQSTVLEPPGVNDITSKLTLTYATLSAGVSLFAPLSWAVAAEAGVWLTQPFVINESFRVDEVPTPISLSNPDMTTGANLNFLYTPFENLGSQFSIGFFFNDVQSSVGGVKSDTRAFSLIIGFRFTFGGAAGAGAERMVHAS